MIGFWYSRLYAAPVSFTKRLGLGNPFTRTSCPRSPRVPGSPHSLDEIRGRSFGYLKTRISPRLGSRREGVRRLVKGNGAPKKEFVTRRKSPNRSVSSMDRGGNAEALDHERCRITIREGTPPRWPSVTPERDLRRTGPPASLPLMASQPARPSSSRARGFTGHLRTARNASLGITTSPTCFHRVVSFLCFSRAFRFRVMSAAVALGVTSCGGPRWSSRAIKPACHGGLDGQPGNICRGMKLLSLAATFRPHS